MSQQRQSGFKGDLSLHHYYMGIINSIPSIVYWIDIDCHLQGCNLHFIKLLGLKHLNNFSATPYDLMAKHLSWTEERIKSFKLDDMTVLFKGEPTYNVEEAPVTNKKNELTYYCSTRVPLYNENNNIIGLVVVLVDITAQRAIQEQLDKCNSVEKPVVNAERMNIPLRVLLVEDSELALNVERAALAELNCEVDVATTGDEAAVLFTPGKYVLVFMDIGLEGTNGYVIAKEFRKLEKTEHHVPIIALTGYLAENVKYDCLDSGMEGVINKKLVSSKTFMQLINRFVYKENIMVDGLYLIERTN
jgi:CheY-like chemotaxis protein